MVDQDLIVKRILDHLPEAQAIYLFASCGTPDEWPQSDIDIAVLLPPAQATEVDNVMWAELTAKLERAIRRPVDLVNLRRVSTVFPKEVIPADRRIFCADANAADEFEMLTISSYQKLNEERAEILADGLRTGKFYDV